MSGELLFRMDDLIFDINLNSIVEDLCRKDAEYYFVLENTEARKTKCTTLLIKYEKKTET